jgi:hypothetical protein
VVNNNVNPVPPSEMGRTNKKKDYFMHTHEGELHVLEETEGRERP